MSQEHINHWVYWLYAAVAMVHRRFFFWAPFSVCYKFLALDTRPSPWYYSNHWIVYPQASTWKVLSKSIRRFLSHF